MMMMPPISLSQKRIPCPSACQWDPMDFQAPGRSFNSFVCFRSSFAFWIFSNRLQTSCVVFGPCRPNVLAFGAAGEATKQHRLVTHTFGRPQSCGKRLAGDCSVHVWFGRLFFVAVDKYWLLVRLRSCRPTRVHHLGYLLIYSRHLSSFLASGISPRLSLEPMSFPLKRIQKVPLLALAFPDSVHSTKIMLLVLSSY